MSGYISEKNNLTAPAGLQSRLLPTDAVRGFTGIATCQGKPSGVPADIPGQIPMVVDSLAGVLYMYVNNAWQPMGAIGQDGPSIDAFARLRVSNPFTIFDSKQIFDNQPLVWENYKIDGSSITTAYTNARASTRLSLAHTSTASDYIRQTYQRFNYQPGKSQMILMTARFGASAANVSKKFGSFDDRNGIFVEDDDNGVLQIVRRTYTSGAAVDNKVAQGEWNIDKFDGSGPSGIVLDKTKVQIFMIDLEWLGVGRVRTGWVIDGIPYYAHEFNHANVIDSVYMSTPNLPIRYQLTALTTAVATTGIECICSTVMSEGGQDKLGVLRHHDTGAISSLNSGTRYGILGIRLRNDYAGMAVLVEAVSLLVTTNDTAHWEIRFNPTLGGTPAWTNKNNESGVQVSVGAASLTISANTPGVETDGGYFSQSIAAQKDTPNALRLGMSANSTPDELWLVVEPISNNATIHGSLTWRELQ